MIERAPANVERSAAATEAAGTRPVCQLLFELAATDPVLVWSLSPDAELRRVLDAHTDVLQSLLAHPTNAEVPEGLDALGRLLGATALLRGALEHAPADDAAVAELINERARPEIVVPLARMEEKC